MKIEDCEYPVWNVFAGGNRGSTWCWICQRYCDWWCEDYKREWLPVTRGTGTFPYGTCRSEWVTWTDMLIQYLDTSCAHHCICIFKWTYPMCAANWHGHPRDYQCHYTSLFFLYANQFQYCLTLILLMWRIWWAPNNARKWQMGFFSAFKGLNSLHSVVCTSGCKIK